MWSGRSFLLFALALPVTAGLRGVEAEPAAAGQAAPDDDGAASADDVISLAAYNVKADRIEDFGFRVRSVSHSGPTTLGSFWFAKFSPMITEVVPNSAAAKAGLQPGERILKSEGQSTLGGLFSTGKFGQWYKTEKKKWAEVSTGKTNVTWTLEVETPETKAVRTVKLVVPTPPPRWGASVWHAPEGRRHSTVPESGPLAGLSRTVLDNGIWTLLVYPLVGFVGDNDPSRPAQTGYEWHFGSGPDGSHRITVTQVHGRTEIVLETNSRDTGRWVYLTSPSGALVRAWHWQRKGKSGEVKLAEARDSFDPEVDFWTTKVAKVSARWPLEVRPGYDANAIFATLAAKNGGPAVEAVRPLAAEFLKLPSATEAQRTMFSDAYGKLGAEQDRWAYTETSRGLEDKRVTVTRVDPSQPEVGRSTLLSIDGKPPTPADVQQWRTDGGDTPKLLGDIPPLTNIVDLKDLRVFEDGSAAVVFELPIRNDNADFPTEKFQALFRVNKNSRSFEEIAVKLRDSFRVAGVVKITDAGLQARWQTLDPAYPPQPVFLKGGGGIRILLVKISRDFETTRTDFKRVEPYVEPGPVEPAAAVARASGPR